jgi:prephenate dehydrogenase
MSSHPALRETQVTVIGLGLMGGSLALALREKCRRIVGVARRPESVVTARAWGLVDEATTDPLAGIQGADVVVLATPVRTIIRQISQLGPHLPAGCLLLDLGSTKAKIVTAMARLPHSVQAVGGHPMCGKERAGLDAVEADLYQGKTFVLCPPPGAHPQALIRAEVLVRAIGAYPLIMDAVRHDRLVAAISHLPYLLSAGLVVTAASVADNDPLLPRVATSGFRDTSRLAGSDVTMMRDIMLTNRQAVLAMLTHCRAWLKELNRQIETGDETAIQIMLSEVQRRQKELRYEPDH